MPPTADDTASTLRDEVVELARALPGDLRRVTVRSGERAIEVEWAGCTASSVAGTATEAGPQRGPGVTEHVPDAEPAEVPDGLTAVRAPLVGTFYAAPSPEADPFVAPGDEVEAGQTLGIVEAMKLMNPIVADEPGVVTEILVENAESVEYDQLLMLLRPGGGPR